MSVENISLWHVNQEGQAGFGQGSFFTVAVNLLLFVTVFEEIV
jgi:hypothetical protein